MDRRDSLTSALTIGRLMGMLPVLLVEFETKKRSSARSFQRELIASGVPEPDARELARAYRSGFSLTRVMSLLSQARRLETEISQ